MEIFDLGLAFVWEYDKDFIDLVEQICQASGLTTFIVGEHNVQEITDYVKSRRLHFHTYLDRALDVDEEFEALGKILMRRKVHIFNPYREVLHAIDKATMHLEFISAGINVPYSIIIPPKKETDTIFLSVNDLSLLGRPFIIKPCNNTGGGLGVVTGAETLEEVLRERVYNSEDKYILQEKLYPVQLDGKRAWFRCFWAFGEPIPVWWDDITHQYELLTTDQVETFKLKKLYSILRIIAKLTKLDFFSTEIVLSTKGYFVAIDYVNDQCDMRIKSRHFDGVPDEIVYRIINNLRKKVAYYKKKLYAS